jgi:hypothetical protein
MVFCLEDLDGREDKCSMEGGLAAYDYGGNTIYFPGEFDAWDSGDTDPRWLEGNALAYLAHEVTHAWHDWFGENVAGTNYGSWLYSNEYREQIAVASENKMRKRLFGLGCDIWPRTGYSEMGMPLTPDVAGATTSEEAWSLWDGSFTYVPVPLY